MGIPPEELTDTMSFERTGFKLARECLTALREKIKKIKKKKLREIESQLAGSREMPRSCRRQPERLKCKAQWRGKKASPCEQERKPLGPPRASPI